MGAGRGARKAREGLGAIGREALENPGITASWETIQERYRRLLYVEGVEIHGDELTGEGARRGIAREEVDRVVEGRAPMSKPEILRRKVRYFTDGAVLGSTAFLEQVFQRLQTQNRIGRKRRSGARRMRGADWGELRVLRDLRERAFDPSE
jgi:putative transposase